MSLTDYSSLEKEIKDAPEPKVLEKGTEVKARIIAVRTGQVEKEESEFYGLDYFSVSFDAPNEPLAKEFNDFFWDLAAAKGSMSEKNYLKALRHFRTFADAFGIDYSKPFSIEDELPGKEGWLIVGIKSSDEYGAQNTVQKYLSPNAGASPATSAAGEGPKAPF
jgi:spermidine/putrescine-binding protein